MKAANSAALGLLCPGPLQPGLRPGGYPAGGEDRQGSPVKERARSETGPTGRAPRSACSATRASTSSAYFSKKLGLMPLIAISASASAGWLAAIVVRTRLLATV